MVGGTIKPGRKLKHDGFQSARFHHRANRIKVGLKHFTRTAVGTFAAVVPGHAPVSLQDKGEIGRRFVQPSLVSVLTQNGIERTVHLDDRKMPRIQRQFHSGRGPRRIQRFVVSPAGQPDRYHLASDLPPLRISDIPYTFITFPPAALSRRFITAAPSPSRGQDSARIKVTPPSSKRRSAA
ncbi:hypothetical protein D1872_239670 [compost metagenome]